MATEAGAMSSDARCIPRSALVLGLAGLLPFLASAALVWSPELARAISGAVVNRDLALRALGGYGAVILSFLGGVRWGNLLDDHARIGRWAPLSLSVLPSLIAWPALLLPAVGMLLLLTAGFLFQYMLDVAAVRRHELPAWFGLLRLILTTGAVLSLLIALAAVSST